MTDMDQSATPLPEAAPPAIPEPRHSGLGVTSFVLGMTSGPLALVLIAAAVVAEAMGAERLPEDHWIFGVLGLMLIGVIVAHFVGVGLGIAGLVGRKLKLFAILGLVFNVASVSVILGAVILGVMAE